MIRALVLVVLGLVAIGLIAWLAARVWLALSPAEQNARTRPPAEQARLLARSVRLLERGLDDPMYRQSADWSEIARDIVDDYYPEG